MSHQLLIEQKKKELDAYMTILNSGGELKEEDLKAASDLVTAIEKHEADQKLLEGLKARVERFTQGGEDNAQAPNPKDSGLDESGMKKALTLGERFVKSDNFMEWHRTTPHISQGETVNIESVKVGTLADFLLNRKAKVLGTPDAHIQRTDAGIIDMVDRRALTLLDVIGHGQMDGPFSYLQIVSVTNNAAIVKENLRDEDPLKPVSEIATRLATTDAYTFADGAEITNQLIRDRKALADYLTDFLSYNLDSYIENMILNGTGVEQPTGILKTTGVLQEEKKTADLIGVVESVRRAIGRIRRVGGVSNAVLLNPEDAAEIDLLKDGEGRYRNGGPFYMGARTLWGVPIVENDLVTSGQALVGDFKQIKLLDRTGLSVKAFDQHKDFAARNRQYIRAELDAGLVIYRPNRLALVKDA